MAKQRNYNKNCFKKDYNPEFLSAAFLRGMAFGKSVSAFDKGLAIMSIENKADILLAVKKAYIDMSPRTFVKEEAWWSNEANVKKTKDGKKQRANETDWQTAKDDVFYWLAKRFYNYFKNGCPNFGKWHKDTCKAFLKKFKGAMQQYGYDSEASLKYGKAQKIVNMTFKYLFCFDDARKYEDRFAECHMPIDSYILSWYNEIAGKEDVCKVSWSDLDDKQYKAIQEKTKGKLGNYNPFLAEFYIWAEYNRELF